VVNLHKLSAFKDTQPLVVPISRWQSICHKDVVAFAFLAGFVHGNKMVGWKTWNSEFGIRNFIKKNKKTN